MSPTMSKTPSPRPSVASGEGGVLYVMGLGEREAIGLAAAHFGKLANLLFAGGCFGSGHMPYTTPKNEWLKLSI